MAEVLAKLANSESHWYTINGDTSTDLLLCRQLGFFSRMDVYAFLFTKGLAAYGLNKKTRDWEIAICGTRWIEYLVNIRYGLSTGNVSICIYATYTWPSTDRIGPLGYSSPLYGPGMT